MARICSLLFSELTFNYVRYSFDHIDIIVRRRMKSHIMSFRSSLLENYL